jgi:hypothetical protein
MWRNLLTCAALILTIGCSDSQPQQDKWVKGKGVVDHVSYSTIDSIPHINVWPVKSTSLSEVANVDVFSDFRPGLTFQDMTNRHGPPSETRTLKNQTELRCYRGTNVTLAVGREPLRSSAASGDWWTAWVFPGTVPLPLNAVAKQSVLDQVELPATLFCLVLRESTPLEGSLWITVKSNTIAEVRWINKESTKLAH